MRSLFFAALTLAAIGCGSTPPDVGESTEAICGNGTRPGCGQCYIDDSSPTGGSRTCWICDGDSYTQSCPRPTPPCGDENQYCCQNGAKGPNTCNGDLVCYRDAICRPNPCTPVIWPIENSPCCGYDYWATHYECSSMPDPRTLPQ